MAWEALSSAALGAVIALSGTLLADIRRDRRQRDRDRELDRRRYCTEFALALVRSLSALRDVARQPADSPTRRADAGAAIADLYLAREQLLVSGTPQQLTAGEAAFLRLLAIRDAVRAGATLDSPAYHDVYHPFADALWKFRLTIRADLGQPALAAQHLGYPDWTDREICAVCKASAAG